MNPITKIISGRMVSKSIIKKIGGRFIKGVIIRDRTGREYISDTYWCEQCEKYHSIGEDEFFDHLNAQDNATKWAVIEGIFREAYA